MACRGSAADQIGPPIMTSDRRTMAMVGSSMSGRGGGGRSGCSATAANGHVKSAGSQQVAGKTRDLRRAGSV